MNAAPKYPVATLADMAAIPEDALPRFIAELPAILQTYREVVSSADAIAAATKWPWWTALISPETKAALTLRSIFKAQGMVWVDDDKGTATVTIKTAEDGKVVFSETRKMDVPR